jgi:hypothetical protein
MGMGGAPTELANGRTATADSSENNVGGNTSKVHLPPDGNDGTASTRWCAADGMPHYWQVDLGASHELEHIEIDFEYPSQAVGTAYQYVVALSDDGATFTDSIDQSANLSTTTTQTAPFPANATGRYVRITVTPPATTPSATWASFWEARIYGF